MLWRRGAVQSRPDGALRHGGVDHVLRPVQGSVVDGFHLMDYAYEFVFHGDELWRPLLRGSVTAVAVRP